MHLPHNFLTAGSVVEVLLARRRPDREGLWPRTRSLLVLRRRECRFLLRLKKGSIGPRSAAERPCDSSRTLCGLAISQPNGAGMTFCSRMGAHNIAPSGRAPTA